VAELLDVVHDRSPFRDGLASHQHLEVGDQRSQLLSGVHAGLFWAAIRL